MRIKQLFLTLALLCAIVQGAWAQASWDEVYAMTNTTAANWTKLSAGSTTGKIGTQGSTTYYYADANLSFSNSMAGGSGLTIQGIVYLYVPQGVTVTCTGANASGQTGAGAGIELAAGNHLYFIGRGTVNATGGNAANGGNGGKGNDAEVTYDKSILGGSGGTGGNGGGGAGAGIGTRGGNGGTGGSGGQRNGSYGQETTQYGVDGNAGSGGSTASAMGTVCTTSDITLNATGGSAGSNGTGGSRGLTASQHPGSNVYMASGGGGGGAGGFGGAASDIGTGGPGGGGGGGGAAGNVAWVVYSGTANGYYHAGAFGGKGGTNADGTTAPNGADVELTNPKYADIQAGGLRDSADDYDDDDGWENGNGRHAGGNGAAAGNASTSESALTVTFNAPTQSEWDIVCNQTMTSQSDWTPLPLGSQKGVTIGTAGTTTYYYASGDRTFANAGAGGSGLTIQGTVYLFIASGLTITCTGANAGGATGAGAGIELTEENALCLIGNGAVNATGGNAADGCNGGNGSDAGWNDNNFWSGKGGNGGDGGGGAGAGIGTRGGAGGQGGAGAASVVSKWWHAGGGSGADGQTGATAGFMGSLFMLQPSVSLSATGGLAASSNGSGGSPGKSILDDDTSRNYQAAGGGGGGGGGFGGAATGIGTGGPGGGGGGGGASGNLEWADSRYEVVRAPGGKGGQSVDGTWAAEGVESIMNYTTITNGQVISNYTGWENWDHFVSDQTVGTGGSGSGPGNACTSESPINMTVKMPEQSEWEEVCSQTQTSQNQWTMLSVEGRMGTTLGTAGSTTYYYTASDRTFANVSAGGSGLTILGTVYIFIPSGLTITCKGVEARGATGAGAGIELTEGNTLHIVGNGTMNATGGNGAKGANGKNGDDAYFVYKEYCQPGSGGDGGAGGGGAGAGIGTSGGQGGIGGKGGIAKRDKTEGTNLGVAGTDGSDGTAAGPMGTLDVSSGITLNVKGGNAGPNGVGGDRGKNAAEKTVNNLIAASGGGGGGCGGFGGAAAGIGTGGPGGGGGGGGAAGNSAWRSDISDDNNFYKVGAGGGSGGRNGDGTTSAPNGTTSELTNANTAELKGGISRDYQNDGWEEGNGMYPGGNGGAAGGAGRNALSISGTGTELDPYLISNHDEWDVFAFNVNNSNSYSGKFVKLTNDISVSTMVGLSESVSFQGTFLGDSKTLTFTQGTAESAFSEDYCAPFRFVKNATIRDLKVAGDIYTSNKHAAGLAARSSGTTNITGCVVGTAIYSSVKGDGSHGGIVGYSTGTLNIEGCVYDGRLLTNNGTINCGGFVGEHNGATISVSNSLYAPVSSIPTGWTAIGIGATFVRGATPTITNCDYTETMGDAQGTQCSPAVVGLTILGEQVKEYSMLKVYQYGFFYDGTCYMIPVTISLADNADNSTTISNANACAADVTIAGRTFYRDGGWNTLCLPFDAAKTGPLTTAFIKELDTETAYDGHKTGIEDGTLYLNFKDAESIVAGRPYIVKWTAVSQEHIINPSDEVFAALDFITEVPAVDGGQATDWAGKEDPDKLVDGNTSTKYGLSDKANPWVEFHYAKPITPKGYALMTSDETWSADRNPKSWTIKAKNSGDANWTTLTTVDNTNMDKLPAANNQWTVFKLDNSTAYQYFRFEAVKNNTFLLAELQFCNVQPGSTEIVNPTFEGVTLNADAPTAVTSEDGKVSFTGCYSPVSIAEKDRRSVLYLGDNSTLYYPHAAMTIGAFRAHFTLNGLTAGDPNAGVRAFVLNFDEGSGESTGIISVDGAEGTVNGSDMWYTLDGRKLQGKPTQRGIYINNGKKVVIK